MKKNIRLLSLGLVAALGLSSAGVIKPNSELAPDKVVAALKLTPAGYVVVSAGLLCISAVAAKATIVMAKTWKKTFKRTVNNCPDKDQALKDGLIDCLILVGIPVVIVRTAAASLYCAAVSVGALLIAVIEAINPNALQGINYEKA